MKARTYRKDKVQVITLGCAKNLVDSEILLGQLNANNYTTTAENQHLSGDIVIINTCGFIDNAKQESIDTILEFADLREQGKIKKLYVTGCLSQRYGSELAAEIPTVDAFFGTKDLPLLLKTLKADYKHELVGERLITTPSHYAYLKISEGCNRTCSFCAIPLMRGKHVSKPIETLIEEAKKLAAKGVRELILIAQELTYYGLDIYGKRSLPKLLEQLSRVEGVDWVRLHYAYPSKFPLELLDAINQWPEVCRYLDMPIQHISESILSGMHRQVRKDETVRLLDTIRKTVPGIAIRTTLLVGFPGETTAEFEELCAFVKEQQFDRLGVFTYSHEESTPAHQLEDNIPQKVKEERAAQLMAIQEKISLQKNREKEGKQYKVIIDRKEGGYYVGRTEFDSPEVDNDVLIDSNDTYVRIGDFVDVEVIEGTEFDLIAKVVN